MTTYVFAIGGTGARVLRSLTMMLASGAKCETEEVIPIIIDLDAQNGDTNRTLQLIDRYRSIREKVYGNEAASVGKFFSPKVSALNKQDQNGANGDGVPSTFQLEFANSAMTFQDYLETSTMSKETQALLKLLYNDSLAENPNAELNLKLDKGFKGNPNIGSVIFTQLVDNEMFNLFTSTFKQGDKIFVVSSIFGGTGSAGFPQLINILRDPELIGNNFINNAPIGAVSVLPYFNVEPDDHSAIDSDLFVSKAKAALSYYSKSTIDQEVDAMYYIADRPGKPYQNAEGGQEQQNKAHVVEMLSATAFFHFVSNHDNRDGKAYEFGISEDANPIEIQHLYSDTVENFVSPLTRLILLTKLFLDFIPDNQREPFIEPLALKTNRQNRYERNFYSELNEFLTDYRHWLKELRENQRAFEPFNLQADFNELIKGKEIETGWFRRGISNSYLKSILAKNHTDLEGRYGNPDRRFIELAEASINQIMNEKIGSIA